MATPAFGSRQRTPLTGPLLSAARPPARPRPFAHVVEYNLIRAGVVLVGEGHLVGRLVVDAYADRIADRVLPLRRVIPYIRAKRALAPRLRPCRGGAGRGGRSKAARAAHGEGSFRR